MSQDDKTETGKTEAGKAESAKAEIDRQVAESIRNFSARAKDDPARPRNYIELPDFIEDKAARISAHFLLPAGGRIVDMGSATGEVTYVLARLNPRLEVIGADRDPSVVAFARKTFRLPNLTFITSDISIPDVPDESVDGIVNSNILHGVYSDAGYNPDEIGRLLEKQARKLKTGGTMLIRDYMMPPEDEFVLLEFPNARSKGKDVAQLSDADLLIRFAHTARPLPSGGAEGFRLEEIKPLRPDTRLFRLPHKWALEFIHRKDSRANWNKTLREEYTFFTWQDYERECSKIGMRMVFSAPYANPWVVKNRFKGKFQLYTAAGRPLGIPATNHFIVAQKVADRQSLLLEERRPSPAPVGDLQVTVVRDKKTGVLHELVRRRGEYCDVIPYRITPDNRLIVYVRSGYPRPIINAGQQGWQNIDGKKWSGHLIEPISMAMGAITDDAEANRKMIFDHVRGYAGLRPKAEDNWFVGETYFPAPDQVDEAIEGVFIEVENPAQTSWPIRNDKEALFTELGTITELDAADIVLAAQVGLLPEPRLELHVMDLMRRCKIPLPAWIGEAMPKTVRQAVRAADPETVLKKAVPAEFEEERKGKAVHLKPVKAVFIEEGKVGNQTRTLSAQDVEYVVKDDGIENIALVLPVTRDWDNNLLLALQPSIMPVPNRTGGSGATLNAPSFPMPKDVRTMDEARAFVAAKFHVGEEHVHPLGPSFFTHVGLMPQRIYPFTVSSVADADKWNITYMLESQVMTMIIMFNKSYSFGMATLKAVATMHMRTLNDPQHDMVLHKDAAHKKYQGYSLSTEKIAVDSTHAAGYPPIPSRILGQRGPVGTPIPAAVQERAASARHLRQSYAQAKIQVKDTPGLAQVDKNIDKIAKSLPKKKISVPELKPPAPELPPKG